MQCFYINLDQASARRAALERNFAAHCARHWSLTRFPAFDQAAVGALGVGGILHFAEKACFLSHRSLIGRLLEGEENVFIMEDDAVIGPHTCEIVDHFPLDAHRVEWDVLFTDVCAPYANTMLDLIRLRRELSATGEVTLLNLAEMPFAGSTAYIVNGKSKRKLFALLNAGNTLDVPYDLYLRRLFSEKKLAGFALFPFVTCVAASSAASQIQRTDTPAAELIWNTFRRMVWFDRDLDSQRPIIEDIRLNLCDEESTLFGTLLAAMGSERFQPR